MTLETYILALMLSSIISQVLSTCDSESSYAAQLCDYG